MTVSSWIKFTNLIPSIFFNPTLRFLLLRTICVSSVLLIYNVPLHLDPAICNVNFYVIGARNGRFARKFHIYVYTICSCTFLHHFASAFGPKFSLPGMIDFPLIICEAVAFFLQAITSKWVSAIPTALPFPSACESDLEQPTIPNLFAWLISLSLVLIAIVRFAEALESKGRYLWVTYDITGLKLTPRRAQYNKTTKPNGFQVITGVYLWTEHFTGEGRWLVLSRGIFALSLMIVAVAFSFSTLIVDPVDEGVAPPVKITRTLHYPNLWEGEDLYLIVGLNQWGRTGPIDVSGVITTTWYGRACPLYDTGPFHSPSGDRNVGLFLVTFRCKFPSMLRADPFDSAIKESSVSVGVNYATLGRALGGHGSEWMSVQVMIGHYNVPSAVVRRTQSPVVLLPGMNLLGFAQQHLVRQFTSPGLATFGLSLSYEKFLVSEITHVQTNSQGTPISNDTASLLVYPRLDFSDFRTIQDYREKSVLKGFSSVGGLWTVLAFFFGVLFGSSLVRVAFGAKPLSISGVAHIFSETTRRKYRTKYSNLNPQTIDDGKDLDALIINHLVDVDLFSEDPSDSAHGESYPLVAVS